MTTTSNWLDYFIAKRKRGPDLNQPVPVGDPMQDLQAKPPEPQSPINRRRWDTYNLNERDRRWMTRERRA